MQSFIRKLGTSSFGVKVRNILGWRPVPISFSHLPKNSSVSDAFIWRVDDNFTTKFKFTDLLPLFTKSKENSILLEFFDHKNRQIHKINLSNLKDVSQEILIDKNLLGTTGYGTFYIYHTSKDILEESITFSNRCYVGYSFKKNLFSYVHGNTYVKSKGIDLKKVNGNMIQSFKMKKYPYMIQNTFKGFDKTELIFVNPHDFNINMFLNEDKFSFSPYEVKIIDFKNTIVNIKSQSYFLRPIVFNYLNDRIDVYHS